MQGAQLPSQRPKHGSKADHRPPLRPPRPRPRLQALPQAPQHPHGPSQQRNKTKRPKGLSRGCWIKAS